MQSALVAEPHSDRCRLYRDELPQLGGDDEIRTRDLSRDRGAFWAI
jgi:hypothetical protein